jgi:DNA mismatch endonuclease (patch repair protein)
MQSKYGFETTSERSLLMSKIKSTNTKPELILRKTLWNSGFRYRINVVNLNGKPDIVFNKHKLAVFVDCEFWHGYKWTEKKYKLKVNRKYWVKKIEGNIERDIKNKDFLIAKGYRVLRFWEHEIKQNLQGCINKISAELNARN